MRNTEARKPTASIAPTNLRYALWREVMGSDEAARAVPIVSPIASVGTSPHHPHGARFYHLDIFRLDAEQIARLITAMARQWGISEAEMERDLGDPTHGIPILDEDVSVTFDARMLI